MNENVCWKLWKVWNAISWEIFDSFKTRKNVKLASPKLERKQSCQSSHPRADCYTRTSPVTYLLCPETWKVVAIKESLQSADNFCYTNFCPSHSHHQPTFNLTKSLIIMFRKTFVYKPWVEICPIFLTNLQLQNLCPCSFIIFLHILVLHPSMRAY